MISFGLIKTSLIDYPGEVAAVLFTRGCNLRCPYCHNPELVEGDEPAGMIPFRKIMDFLASRRNVLGGVCVTGGEPLLHPEIPDVIRELRRSGLKVKLDTNGTLPDRLAGIEADYVAMDLKTAPEKYGLVAGPGMPGCAEAVRESVRILMSSGRDYEFRTTLGPGIVDIEDIRELARLTAGARAYTLAQYRPGKTLDEEYGNTRLPYPEELVAEMKKEIERHGIPCRVRLNTGKPR